MYWEQYEFLSLFKMVQTSIDVMDFFVVLLKGGHRNTLTNGREALKYNPPFHDNGVNCWKQTKTERRWIKTSSRIQRMKGRGAGRGGGVHSWAQPEFRTVHLEPKSLQYLGHVGGPALRLTSISFSFLEHLSNLGLSSTHCQLHEMWHTGTETTDSSAWEARLRQPSNTSFLLLILCHRTGAE